MDDHVRVLQVVKHARLQHTADGPRCFNGTTWGPSIICHSDCAELCGKHRPLATGHGLSLLTSIRLPTSCCPVLTFTFLSPTFLLALYNQLPRTTRLSAVYQPSSKPDFLSGSRIDTSTHNPKHLKKKKTRWAWQNTTGFCVASTSSRSRICQSTRSASLDYRRTSLRSRSWTRRLWTQARRPSPRQVRFYVSTGLESAY
jgi:hypothetical protein